MQRLGLLKLLVGVSARGSANTLLSTGGQVIKALTSKVVLPWDNRTASYVRSALSVQTNARLREQAAGFLSPGYSGPRQVALELQDAYLALGRLPSRRGRLATTDDSRFPHWGIALGLTRKEPFDPLVRGNLLLKLTKDAELLGFSQFDPLVNPLELTRPQRVFFMYVILKRDLSILVPLYERLAELNGTFSDMEAGDLLPELYFSASKALKRTGRGGNDSVWANQLAETASAIRARQGKSYGKTVREQTVTPRLEPFVDLGILAKTSAYSYEYRFTPEGREFFSNMKGKWNGSFSWFGKEAATVFGYGDREVSRDTELLRLLFSAWGEIKSHLGYSPIDETLLLGLIHGLEEGAGWFDLGKAYNTLRSAQKAVPGLLRFNMDRYGRLSVVRFMRPP